MSAATAPVSAAAAAGGPRQRHAPSLPQRPAGPSSSRQGAAAAAATPGSSSNLDAAALMASLWATHPLGITDDKAFLRSQIQNRVSGAVTGSPDIISLRYQASLRWLSHVGNRTSLLKALDRSIQVRPSRSPAATSANIPAPTAEVQTSSAAPTKPLIASTTRTTGTAGSSPASTTGAASTTSRGSSNSSIEVCSVDVDMDTLVGCWLALMYAHRGVSWHRQQSGPGDPCKLMISSARVLLRTGVLHSCAAALAVACETVYSSSSLTPSSSFTSSCTASTIVSPSSRCGQPTPPQQQQQQQPAEHAGCSVAAAGPRSGPECTSPRMCEHVGARVHIRGASVLEFLVSAAWFLLDVPCAVAEELVFHESCDEDCKDDPARQNARQYICELAAVLRDCNILELAARALVNVLAILERPQAADGAASGSVQGARAAVAASPSAETWWVQEGLTLMARTVVKLVRVKHDLIFHSLDDAEGDLSVAMSGPCLKFAVLGRGVAAMVAADGGRTYGLPYERLPRLPVADDRLNDESLACLAFALCEVDLVAPPLKFNDIIALHLRIGRIALKSPRAWRARAGQRAAPPSQQQQQSQQQPRSQQQPGDGKQPRHGAAGQGAPTAVAAAAAARTSDEPADVWVRRWAKAAKHTTGISSMECAMAAVVQARLRLRGSASGRPGFKGKASKEIWRLAIEIASYVGTAVDKLWYYAREDYSCILRPDEWSTVTGGLQAIPNADMALALSSGLLPCLERLVRRAGAGPRSRNPADQAERHLLDSMMDCDDDDDYPLVHLVSYGDPRQVAALLASMGKAARCRRTALARACSAAVQNPSDGLRRVFMGRQAAPGGGGAGTRSSGEASAQGSDTAGVDEQLFLLIESGIFQAMFSPACEEGLLLRVAPKLLAATATDAAATAAAANAAAGAPGVRAGSNACNTAASIDANIPAAPPAHRQLAVVVSLVAQQWLPDLAGPLPWAVRHTEKSGLVADMMELRHLRNLELPMQWIQLLAIVPESDREAAEGEATGSAAAAAAPAAAAAAAAGSAGPAAPGAATSVTWRRRALQQLGAVPLLGLGLRLQADENWRQRLELPELTAGVDGPRLALLADCMCRVAALMPGDVRQAVADWPANRQAGGAQATEAARAAYCLAKVASMHAQKERMDAVGRAAGLEGSMSTRLGMSCGDWTGAANFMMETDVFATASACGIGCNAGDSGAAPLSYWPPGLVRRLGRELRRLGRSQAAAAVQDLASQLEGLAKESPAQAERRLAAVAAPEAPEGMMAAAAALVPPDVVQQVMPLRTCSHPGCTNLSGDSEVELRLMRCSRCGGTVSYCSRDCQRAHWRGGHKSECRVSAVAEAGSSEDPTPPPPPAPLQQ